MSRVIATILNLRDNWTPTLKKATDGSRAFQNEVKKTQSSIKEMSKATEAVGKIKSTIARAAAGLAIGEAVKQSIDLASSLVEVQNVVDTTFGKGASQINTWSNTALKSFGLSQLQAKQFTGTLGAMMKSSGITGNSLITMSQNLTGLSGDFASFYNLPIEESFEKIKSGISGETEPLKSLGINMSVANLQAFALASGIKKSYQSMSQAEQTTLRYNYLMKTSKDMQGDFAKTSNTFANQLRIAKTNLQQTGATIATHLLPYLNKGLQAFNGFLDVLPKVGDVLGKAFKADTAEQGIQIIAGYLHNFLWDKIPHEIDNSITNMISTVGNDIVGFKKPFQDFLSSVSNLFATISGNKDAKNIAAVVIPNITSALDDVMKAAKDVLGAVTDVFNFISNNWGTIAPLIAGVAAGFAVYNGIVLAMKIPLMIATAQQWLLNTAMYACPTTWLIIAIAAMVAAVVAAGVYMYQNWDTVQARFSAIWDGIKDIFYGAVNYCIGLINQLIDAVNFLDGIDLPDGTRLGFGKLNHVGYVGLNKGSTTKNETVSVKGGGKHTKYATGTQYYSKDFAITDERGGEIKQYPNGTKIIPHDLSEKMVNDNNQPIEVNVIIQGNVIGNEEYADYIGTKVANEVNLVLANK
ncbi:hypothetical protein ACJDT4_12505 [Clostridium neuense]|uniref:Phage tail tape measure protein n=1 Tax=Clostridium neuense TaxID=1728934 RepID=A0ABW8TJX0_9CLOT